MVGELVAAGFLLFCWHRDDDVVEAGGTTGTAAIGLIAALASALAFVAPVSVGVQTAAILATAGVLMLWRWMSLEYVVRERMGRNVRRLIGSML
jgi:hypothetical protein